MYINDLLQVEDSSRPNEQLNSNFVRVIGSQEKYKKNSASRRQRDPAKKNESKNITNLRKKDDVKNYFFFVFPMFCEYLYLDGMLSRQIAVRECSIDFQRAKIMFFFFFLSWPFFLFFVRIALWNLCQDFIRDIVLLKTNLFSGMCK